MINEAFWKGKKVLVTGHTGFKGSWLCEMLLLLGADVAGYALKPEKISLFNLLNLQKRMKSYICDICDLGQLLNVVQDLQPEIIFHLAAQPLVRTSYKEPHNTYETNVMGTVNILEAARNSDFVKSILNVTTDKVYRNFERDDGYIEDEELCGIDPYSNSKSCAELVTFSYKASFFNAPESTAISTARAGNVIGGGDFSKDRIIPDCVRATEKGEPIYIRHPSSVRPYQHVLDCLSGYLILAEKQYYNNKIYSGCYNFGPDHMNNITTQELVRLFSNQWEHSYANGSKKIVWEIADQTGPHEANFLSLNSEKAKRILGWGPKYDIKTSVQKTVDWYIEYLKIGNLRQFTQNQIEEYLE